MYAETLNQYCARTGTPYPAALRACKRGELPATKQLYRRGMQWTVLGKPDALEPRKIGRPRKAQDLEERLDEAIGDDRCSPKQ